MNFRESVVEWHCNPRAPPRVERERATWLVKSLDHFSHISMNSPLSLLFMGGASSNTKGVTELISVLNRERNLANHIMHPENPHIHPTRSMHFLSGCFLGDAFSLRFGVHSAPFAG